MPGDLDPEVLDHWETACQWHFLKISLADELQVATVASRLEDPRLQVWYEASHDHYHSLKFDVFLQLMRDTWLPRNWECLLKDKILALHQEKRSFWDWANEVQAKAKLLMKTVETISKHDVKQHSQAHANKDLKCLIRSPKYRSDLAAHTSFQQWLLAVKALNEEHIKNDKRVQVAIAEAVAKVKAPPNKTSNLSITRVATISCTVNAPAGTENKLPCLTEAERRLLRENDGCYKCRRPFVKHVSTTCPYGFPDTTNYKPVTEATIRTAKNQKPVIAAVVEEEEEDKENIVAAVLPSRTTVYDSVSESDSKYIELFTLPSLYWNCLLDGPLLPLPISVDALIDPGSHTVLVSSSLVDQTGLCRYRLPKPKKIRQALEANKEIVCELYEYVHLRVKSHDSRFWSIGIPVCIFPCKTPNIILGLPLLKVNKINVHSNERTAIHKTLRYDLLNPTGVPGRAVPPRNMSPGERWSRVVAAMHSMIDQLCARLEQQQADVDRRTHTPQYDPQPAIQMRIEQLERLQWLPDKDAELKLQYADRFPADIPHTDELPTDVYHAFRLKDPNKVIASRVYPCLRKYQQAWRALLQQHLDAGHIRPLSSEYTSPGFIIPKATALPRWVNDYRKLNDNTVADQFPLPRIDDILADCAKGKIWGKINVTNTFFQMRVYPEHVKYTAVNTPFGLYEWLVMPMGCRNAPPTHQMRMMAALRPLIGKTCHVYLDDIIIWSQDDNEHRCNIATVMEALRAAKLFCSLKKTQLFCDKIDFLGHQILQRGIEADQSKVDRIGNWPRP